MITFLQKYLQIDTSHPEPDYGDVIALFVEQASSDGFECQIVTLQSGRQVLIISYPGSDANLPSLLLNHHMDVVPALNKSLWKHPPFAGVLDQGVIYGRGTQDMKGVGVVHYFALQQLKQQNLQPARTIHLCVVPDEEIGGVHGVGEFVQTEAFKKLNVGFVLDEGLASGDEKNLCIKVAERKVVQVLLTSTGQLTHGSRINCLNAVHELTRFLAHVVQHQAEQKAKLAATPAGLLLSMNITSFQAGVIQDGQIALNSIPDSATATIDIRVPPTMPLNQAHEMLDLLIKNFPDISYIVLIAANERAFNQNYEHELYTELKKTVCDMGLAVKPLFAEEGSDLRFYHELGIQGLGITPFTIKDNIHGTDESVRIADLELGKNLFYNFLINFCVRGNV